MRIGLILLIFVALAAPRLADQQTWILLQTMRELGPVSGWRCANASAYIYHPSREQADPTLLSERPEARVLAQVPWLEIDQVEANLRGGDTLVSTHANLEGTAEGDGENEGAGADRRVYVLSPGRLQSINAVMPSGRVGVCNAHLGDWQIVGEQDLG